VPHQSIAKSEFEPFVETPGQYKRKTNRQLHELVDVSIDAEFCDANPEKDWSK